MGGNMQTFLTNLVANKDAIAVLKDIVTILGTATAAIVAVIGLQTWRKQIRGNAEYDLARRVLTAVYRVRDAIRNCRVPGVRREDGGETHKKFHDLQISKLEEEQSKLDVELLEAEAIWGHEVDFYTAFIAIRTMVDAMRYDYNGYYSDLSDLYPEMREGVYGDKLFRAVLGADEYDYKVLNAVEEVENYIRPKLLLKQGTRRR
jgi:hypothetical protein